METTSVRLRRRPWPSRVWWKLALAGVAVTGVVLAAGALDAPGRLRDALDAIARLGAWGPVLFVLVYVVAAVVFFPAVTLTLGAGIVFGVVRGSITVSIAATLGATAAFLVGRYLARGWVARRIAGHARFRAIDDAVADEGWKIVLLTRLSPVFPFTLLNYAFGLTRIRLPHYVLASWIGMIPGTVMYVYLGSLAGDLATLGSAGGRARTPAEWALSVVGLLATIAVTVFVTRLARRALAERITPVAEGA